MDRDKLYTVPDLKDRGWSASAIKLLLPVEPDDTRDNPRYARAGAPMKLWLKTRVHRVEMTKRFQSWKEGADVLGEDVELLDVSTIQLVIAGRLCFA